ncbi:MAG TPA: dihydrolipoamide acetyltransferase family protein [Candidatus Manganitrophaceae bacterium]|nr:dihydrolipoamide acetyltransferase family protein [Candidatus Manganitrophaceae bacterium]
MASRVVMPKLTDTMEEGVLLKWYKREGEKVESGDPIAEVETDKAIMDLEAFASGTLKKILVPAGHVVPSGDLIALIAGEDEDVEEILSHETPPRMRKREEKGAPSAKEPKEMTTPQVEVSPQEAAALQEKGVKEAKPAPPPPAEGEVKASPLARKMAEEGGIDLRTIKGTGPGGRITQRDVESAALAPTEKPPIAGVPSLEGEEIVLSMMRKSIAKRMVQSKAPVPHFYVTSEIDMGKILAFREEMERESGVKLTLSDLFLKAVALTLQKFPSYRSVFQGDRLRVAKQIDVGLAIGTEEGVITAVIRDCDHKTLSEISQEVKDKVKRAREKRLRPEEYTGSVFSVSNLGMYDVESFSAIITPPESGVLAIGSVLEKPVVTDGKIGIGKTVKATLSTDHRVADGVQAAEFLKELKRIIQNPLYLAL